MVHNIISSPPYWRTISLIAVGSTPVKHRWSQRPIWCGHCHGTLSSPDSREYDGPSPWSTPNCVSNDIAISRYRMIIAGNPTIAGGTAWHSRSRPLSPVRKSCNLTVSGAVDMTRSTMARFWDSSTRFVIPPSSSSCGDTASTCLG